MNQPQKNNSQTTDIRQKHINAIRQRLKQKREEYCKTRSDKNILGPGAIHNYLKENYHVYKQLYRTFVPIVTVFKKLIFPLFSQCAIGGDVIQAKY